MKKSIKKWVWVCPTCKARGRLPNIHSRALHIGRWHSIRLHGINQYPEMVKL